MIGRNMLSAVVCLGDAAMMEAAQRCEKDQRAVGLFRRRLKALFSHATQQFGVAPNP